MEETTSTNDATQGFKRDLPETCVEYMVFLLVKTEESRNVLSRLESIRKSALRKAREATRDYIWQRDDFNLELRHEKGLSYLYGATDYGDSVEDEWLIVYLLRELSTTDEDIWIRVFDNDGEFLLIEAANALPNWITPEIDCNRPWVSKGQIHIIPLKETPSALEENSKLDLPEAVNIIQAGSRALSHSPKIDAEAFSRLQKYPGQIAESTHHAMITVPRTVAYILHNLPRSIAPAIEAFYLRDALSLKPLLSPSSDLIFPPEDLVTLSARFSKVLFAQLRSQHFEPPPRWKKPMRDTEEDGSSTSDTTQAMLSLETGMKLTCGYEMLASKAGESNNRAVREMKILLDDLEEDGGSGLPSNDDIQSWPHWNRNDSEKWLDINYDDFERELGGRQTHSKGPASGFGDVKTQDDLRRIVSRFESFLNDDTAGLDGAQINDMDVDDDPDGDEPDEAASDSEEGDVTLDEEAFSRMMREMMGLQQRPLAQQSSQDGDQARQQSIADSDHPSQDDIAIRGLASQMEAELKQHNALRLDEPSRSALKGTGETPDPSKGGREDEEEDENELDIDYNLAKNLLESFKSQAGMAGPTGNLLGMMGFQLPRDEDDENPDGGAIGDKK